MNHSEEKINLAKELWLKQWTILEIATELAVSERTVYNWKEKGQWKSLPSINPEIIISQRLNTLAGREKKTDAEIKEFEMLAKAMGKLTIDLANAKRIIAEAGYISKNGLPNVTEQYEKQSRGEYKDRKEKKKSVVKNDISGITREMIMAVFTAGIMINGKNTKVFSYQRKWWDAKEDKLTRRTRFILKSRQIGATFYFAWEAFVDAILTGDNQIFLSASRDQAEVFKAYIISFAKNAFELEIKGAGVIILSNGAQLRFLSTNSTTAQSYTGHLYTDEVLWIMNFVKVNKVASAIASHKKWRKTYFSTASTLSHPAWSIWDGSVYNSGLIKNKRIDFDISHAATKDGVLYADGIWRHFVTVIDAEEQGCDLFDIKQLKQEYSKNDFDNLFMGIPIDDAQSVFSLALLMSCMIKSDEWTDYHPKKERPFLNMPVSIGYDPSATGDGASLAILDVPQSYDKPFRLLTIYRFYGKNFTHQAESIRDYVDRHNVSHLGIDNTGGTGLAVSEKVQQFYPQLTMYHYTPQVKSALVGKALDLMENGRFKYLESQTEVTRAFMMITQSSTDSGGAVTYKSARVSAGNSHTNHADDAWAIMHAMAVEPIAKRNRTQITFTD